MKKRAPAVAEFLRYVCPDGPNRLSIKPHGLLACFRFRGHEPAGGNAHVLNDYIDRLTQSLGCKGSEWVYHISVRRGLDAHYPATGAWPSTMIYALDQARALNYLSEGQHLPTEHHLWIAYHPDIRGNQIRSALTGDLSAVNENAVTHFEQELSMIEGTLRANAYDVERLALRVQTINNEQIITSDLVDALFSEINLRDGSFAIDVDEPMFLDGILAPDQFSVEADGVHLNNERLLIATIWGMPAAAGNALFYAMGKLPVPSRFTARIIPLTNSEADKAWDKKSRNFLLSMLDLSIFFPRNGAEGGEAPRALRAQAEHEKTRANTDTPFATAAYTIVARCANDEIYADVSKRLNAAAESLLIRISFESPRAAAGAYFGSLPGESDAHSLRNSTLTQSAALRLAPVLSTWNGPKTHPRRSYPNTDPILMLSTPQREPFRMYHHDGEVGHTLVLGKTGLGKSVLLRAMENGHLSRYPNAEVLALDIGYSAIKYANAISGTHIVADLNTPRQFALLAGIEHEESRENTAEVIADLTEIWTGKPITLADYKAIADAIKELAGRSPTFRCISQMATVIQDTALRSLYSTFADSFLDGHAGEDLLALDAARVPYWAIEYGTLGIDNARWVSPFIAHVQRRYFESMDKRPNRPRLLVMDEGARAIKSRRIENLKERLDREGRKHNVSAIFATQGADEVLKSTIRQVIIEQCATLISFRNPLLRNTETRKDYREVGFTDEQCDLIATGLGDHDFLIVNSQGHQVVRLNPVDLELAFYGGASDEDREIVQALLEEHGPGTPFAAAYLRSRRDLPDALNYAQGIEAYEPPRMEVIA